MKVKLMRKNLPRTFVAVAAISLTAFSLAGCSGMALSTTRIQGYAISEDAMAQIRPGQSQDLVVAVLGSPQTQNAFDEGTAWYYVQTRVSQTAFGLTSVLDRTVLAVYFDKNKRVADKAVYTLKDGKVVAMEGQKTPSFGQDKSFIQSLIDSI